MKSRFLDVTIYEQDGWAHRTETFPLSNTGDLEQITAAINRLDRFCYPMIFIRQKEMEDSDYMNITGGQGAFMIEVQSSEFGRFIDYIEVEKGAEMVELWRSDQGMSVPEYLVCRDLNLVLVVAHEYAVSGVLSDQVDWLLRR